MMGPVLSNNTIITSDLSDIAINLRKFLLLMVEYVEQSRLSKALFLLNIQTN